VLGDRCAALVAGSRSNVYVVVNESIMVLRYFRSFLIVLFFSSFFFSFFFFLIPCRLCVVSHCWVIFLHALLIKSQPADEYGFGITAAEQQAQQPQPAYSLPEAKVSPV
jgi:hypothetical protein